MKESLNEENNKKNNDKDNNKFQIISTGFGILKYYTLNSFKNLSKKISYFYPNFSKKAENKKNSNINNEININHDNIIKNENISFNKINLNKNLDKENELLIYNNTQIKKNIFIFLENELKINETKIELKNNNNSNKLAQINKYKEFKNKTLIYFFSSTIINKYYNIISITSLCIIFIMKNIKFFCDNENIKLTLDNIWNITNKTSKNIFSNISEIISNNIEKILINEKFNKNSLDDLISNMHKELRDKCNFFIHILKEIKKEIKNIENKFYDFNEIKNNMILEYKLRFFNIFYNLLFSDLFYSTFVQSYEGEILKFIEEIKNNFGDKNDKSFLAIIFDIDSFRNKQLVINEENIEFDKDNDKSNDEILMNYQKCLKSIFI